MCCLSLRLTRHLWPLGCETNVILRFSSFHCIPILYVVHIHHDMIRNVLIAGENNGCNFRGTVAWYSRVRELPADLQRCVESSAELFLNQRGFDKEIELETILDVIQVIGDCTCCLDYIYI